MSNSPYNQPYNQPHNQAGYAPPPAGKTNTLAIIALIASFFISIVGVVLGHIALSQIKRTGEGGRGLAIAALVIGYLGILFAIILVIVMAGAAAQSGVGA